MDKDFQDLLDRMHRHRQVQYIIYTTAVFFAGVGTGFLLAACLFGVL